MSSPDISRERAANLTRSEYLAIRLRFGEFGDVDVVDIMASDAKSERNNHQDKDQEAEEEDEGCSDDVYQLLFEQYARFVDGRLLMSATDLERFFRSLAVGARAPSKAKLDALYGEQIQLQQDLRFKYSLSRMEATRGICFEVFMVILGKACPRGLGSSTAKAQHKHYAGSARLARGARLICIDAEPLAW